MSILTVSVLGITAVLLAVQLKGKGGEYGTYIVMAAGLCLFFYAAGKLEVILKTLRTMESCIGISPVYLSALLKMAGITYIAEFASGICKDAGSHWFRPSRTESPLLLQNPEVSRTGGVCRYNSG